MTERIQAASIDQLRLAIDLLGSEGTSEEQAEAKLIDSSIAATLAKRMVVWIPEVFGLILVTHLAERINPPTRFSARSRDDKWVEFELVAEPIFRDALPIAAGMFHSGPREAFRNIALRSSLVAAANNALNAGASLDGATLSGPALIGIPAEIYASKRLGIWRRLLRWVSAPS